MTKFNWALVLSVVVLLIFSYITFLGLVYNDDNGDWKKPLLFSAILVVVVLLCVLAMRWGKQHNNKQTGLIVQLVFGFIILVVFMLSAIMPFSSFLRVWHDSDSIVKKVETVCDTAIAMDSTYVKYVDKRVTGYKENLHRIAEGKNNRPSEYRDYLEGASGNTDDEKIESLASSLRKRLLPDSTACIVAKRQKWLNEVKEVKILNPLTAANIIAIDTLVDGKEGWRQNYIELSSISYKGENDQSITSFDYPQFNSKVQELMSDYRFVPFKAPKFWAIVVALLCCFVMLLPFFAAKISVANLVDNGNNLPSPSE